MFSTRQKSLRGFTYKPAVYTLDIRNPQARQCILDLTHPRACRVQRRLQFVTPRHQKVIPATEERMETEMKDCQSACIGIDSGTRKEDTEDVENKILHEG